VRLKEKQANRRALPLTGDDLTIADFRSVVMNGRAAKLDKKARRRVEAARRLIQKMVESEALVYGVTTGLGKLADVRVSHDEIRELQVNLVRSHACGVGKSLSELETRAMILLRANVLAKGYSGCRPVVIETLCEMLNRGIHPVIPARGSVGASGDLAPLAHLALVLMGEGQAIYRGECLAGGEAMKQAGVKPVTLEAKEGLALLNGTQAMLALGLLALLDAEILADSADVAGALSLDALRGTPAPFDKRIHTLRPHPGQQAVARHLEALNRGSQIRESHRECGRVQDAYSLRCMPQVHGTVRDALAYVRRVFEIEMNSATDNPLVFANDGEVLSGGNFHGQPLALALDLLTMALTQLGGISERRIERLVNPALSDLPPFLAEHPGLHCGFMTLQVAAAALASENKALSYPASVDSITTSGNKEDYVSMGMGAALKARQVVTNVRSILAIELLAACQGLDFLAPLKTGPAAMKAHRLVRSVSPRLVKDRSLAQDIAEVGTLIAAGKFQQVLQQTLR
jgi:histidine ammonia-lyase